jgi:hypothetical protein
VPYAVCAVGLREAEARVDDADVADDANARIDGCHVLARARPADPVEESGAGLQRPIWTAGQKAHRQVLVEPPDVGRLGGLDIAAIELFERLDLVGARHRLFPPWR